MKDLWDTLQAKEQLMASLVAILVIIAILYLAVWSPAVESRNNIIMRIENKRETLAWMGQKRLEVEHLKRTNTNLFNQVSDNRSLLTIIDAGARQMGIRGSITRIVPNGEDKVQISLENVVFDRLIVLLGELGRRNDIQVTSISLNKSEQISKVTGSVTLSR